MFPYRSGHCSSPLVDDSVHRLREFAKAYLYPLVVRVLVELARTTSPTLPPIFMKYTKTDVPGVWSILANQVAVIRPFLSLVVLELVSVKAIREDNVFIARTLTSITGL